MIVPAINATTITGTLIHKNSLIYCQYTEMAPAVISMKNCLASISIHEQDVCFLCGYRNGPVVSWNIGNRRSDVILMRKSSAIPTVQTYKLAQYSAIIIPVGRSNNEI
jgi:hypothetical protein